ncbi:MAG: hypothetical protein R3C10_13305 [Pirellulales bacterium]
MLVSDTGDIGGPVPNDEFFVLAQVTSWGGDLSVRGELLSIIGEPGNFGATFTVRFADDSAHFVNTDFDATLDGDNVPGWYYQATADGGTMTEPLMRGTPTEGDPGVFVYDDSYSLPTLDGTHTVLMQANGESAVALVQDRLFDDALHTLEFLVDFGDSALEDLSVLINDAPLDLVLADQYDFMGRTVRVLRADVSAYAGTTSELKFDADPFDGVSDVAIAIDRIRLVVPEPASMNVGLWGIVAALATSNRQRH